MRKNRVINKIVQKKRTSIAFIVMIPYFPNYLIEFLFLYMNLIQVYLESKFNRNTFIQSSKNYSVW